MGRFFKTTTPQNVDFMYQLPEDLMLKATGQASQDITENQGALYDLYSKLILPANPNDKPRAKEILAGYEDKVNELSQQLMADPMTFRRKGGDILGLARTLHKDFTTGEAGAIAGNYQSYVKMLKDTEEDVKAKRVTDTESINPFINSQLRKFGKTRYNAVTGDYTSFNPDRLVGTYDIEGELAKNAKEMVDHKIATAEAKPVNDGTGRYIVEYGGKREYKTMGELMRDALTSMSLNQPAMQYIKQRNEIGMMPDWIDEKGNLNLKGGINKDGTLTSDASPFYRLAHTIADRFDYDNVTDAHKTLKGDSNFTRGRGKLDAIGSIGVNTGSTSNTSFVGVDKNNTAIPLYQQAVDQVSKLNESVAPIVSSAGVTLTDIIRVNPKIDNAKKIAIYSQIQSATKKAIEGYPEDLYKIYDEYGTGSAELNTKMNQAKAAKTQAKNIESQLQPIRRAVEKQNPHADSLQINNLMSEAMKKAKNIQTVNLYEATGTELKSTDADGQLEHISKEVAKERLPDSVILSERDANGTVINKQILASNLDSHLTGKTKSNKPSGFSQQSTVKDPSSSYKNRGVTKVLEDITYIDENGKEAVMSQPFRVELDNGSSIYIDKSAYPSDKIDEAVQKESSNIHIKNELRKAHTLAVGSRSAVEAIGGEYEPAGFRIINDGILYIPSQSEGGVGNVMIDYGHPVKLPNGKIVQNITVPENSAQLNELIKLKSNTTK